ncbi:zinc-dependent alcohol dehydrogenase [Phaeacidiphilus oryzae]|uniref:zinc-dependent alcohol dehydrogenase n=1 Tax=Phaeacidiphilus oryzae TaxID=348818 RepID=UPI00055F10AE|nr:zinc-dependent alcohol dehydrogenase [Phaeacidiphilus oryzae]
MKALTWQGKRDVRVEEVPDPRIEQPTDVVVEISSTGLCGSDLHLYEVLGPFLDPGDILGHEPMGTIVETGSEVTEAKVGDRVVVPFNVSCNSCPMCTQGLQSQCETTQVHEYGSGASLFGYTKLYGQVPGGQAEYLRVPFGDSLPIHVPEGPPDDRYVFLSDVLPTAWQAVRYADVPPGGSLAVLGLGPIGDMATRIARHLGVEQVIGIDLVPERLERARSRGVHTLDLRERGQDLVVAVRELTGGRGPDAVIDAVGMEAHGSPFGAAAHRMVGLLPDSAAAALMQRAGTDRMRALHLAVELVRRGGTISLSGVYGGQADPMPMLRMFDKQIQLRMGQANVLRWVGDILPLLTDADPLGVDDFATHRLPLSEAPAAYEMFQKKEDGAVKVLFKP